MNFKPGTRLKVKPVIFYPKGVAIDSSWVPLWTEFHASARVKYRSLLKNRDTFELDTLHFVQGELTAAEYKRLCFTLDGLKTPDRTGDCSAGVERILAEMLRTDLGGGKTYTRYTLPFCLSVLMIDPARQWIAGGGRSLNGAYNLGGGILVMASWLHDEKILMSTLVHELGHTFGLVHITDRAQGMAKTSDLFKCYYDLNKSPSIMGYNTANHTNSTIPTEIPGCLLGDEIHALSLNKLVFPDLFFNPAQDFDCPALLSSCPPHDKVVREDGLGPMHMFWCTTAVESVQGSSITNLNDTPGRWILSNDPATKFVPERMWHSGPANAEGWVSLDVTFPLNVTLDRILVHTGHSGQFHQAEMVQVERRTGGGAFSFLKRVAAPESDVEIAFPASSAEIWRVAFKAGPSEQVVVRGLRFFAQDKELFPPLGPHGTTEYGEEFGSRVSNLFETQRLIRSDNPAVGFDPRSMWHSAKVNPLGWVSAEVTFPTRVTLDKIDVYSRHSGQFHPAASVQVERADPIGNFIFVHRTPLANPSGSISFASTKAKTWKIAFQSQHGGHVVIRGLRFRIENEEFYPPSKVEQ